ncbi:crossover junction endodeoxyribonuclease RuvC [Candidatus Kaiserbacteria bacterium]|nr:crossover junction endodeoxyribonuclease RuvC [Candidatus Kaiserbacteria bacterium]
MKVLGIDPGYGRCGVAIVEKVDGREIYLYSDCIETSPKDEFTDRLAAVADGCARLMREHTPDHVAMERLYFTNNQKTAMKVAEVRGALLNTAALANIPVFEYTPGQIKNASTGYGGADKTTVARMLKILLKIDKEIKHDDEYDAIAVGVTHLAHSRTT